MTFVLTKTGAEVFAPTDGSGNPRGAVMSEAATLLTELEAQLRGVVVGSGSLAFETLADLNAALDYDENQKAEVRADGANNGIYAKVGASGGGSWLYLSPLPDAIAVAVDNRFLAGAGNLTLSGANNTGAGVGAADALTTGSDNTAGGKGALGALTTGSRNTADGVLSLSAATTADDGTAVGYGALVNSTGIRNTAVGSAAGGGLSAGERNTFLGYGAGASGGGQVDGLSDTVAIGALAYTTNSNQAALPDAIDEIRAFGTVAWRGYLSKRAWFFGELAGSRNMQPGSGAVVGIGSVALASLTTATQIVAVGDYAMNEHTTGSNCAAVGAQAMRRSISMTDCVAFGSLTFGNATTGIGGVAIGHRSMEFTLNAGNNVGVGDSTFWLYQGQGGVSIGYRANEYTLSGDDGVFIGRGAGVNRQSGHRNVYVGAESGSFPGVTPNPVTGVGAQAAGNDNTALGYMALRNATSNANTAIGKLAGETITTGANNTFLGKDAGYNGSQKVDAANSMALGSGSYTDADNQVVLGDGNITEVLLRSASSVLKLNGGRVRFPSTQVPSADANTLDDYRESQSWTPTVLFGGASVGLTFTSRTGIYWKIGNLYVCRGVFLMSAKGSSTGAATIGGLPGSPGETAVTIGYYDGFSGLTGVLIGQRAATSGAFNLYQTGATGVAAVTDAAFTNSSRIYFTLTYEG